MNTSKKTVLVACSVASLALLPVQLHDEGSQAMALPAEMLPTLATSVQAEEAPPTNPDPTPTVPVEPPVEPVPVPSDAPVPPEEPVPSEDPVPTPTEDPVLPEEPVPSPTEPAPPVEPVPTPIENPVPPVNPDPPVEPVPTPIEDPVIPVDPAPVPVDPLPPADPAPGPSPEPTTQPQPVNPVPGEPVSPVPVQSQEPSTPSNNLLAIAQRAPADAQPRVDVADTTQQTPSLRILGADPAANLGADSNKAERSPLEGSVLGLTSAPQQNYSGTPEWVEGFLNASEQNILDDTANNSNQAAGVMGAEAQGHQLEPTSGSNVFQRGMSIVTGARPLLIFSGVAVAGLALVVFNFVWRNRTPKA